MTLAIFICVPMLRLGFQAAVASPTLLKKQLIIKFY